MNPMDTAGWRPTFPLAALVACKTSEEIAVWIALAWYQAAFPRAPVVLAVIADMACIPEATVEPTIAALAERDLVERTASGVVKIHTMFWSYLSAKDDYYARVAQYYQHLVPQTDPDNRAGTFTIEDEMQQETLL